MISIESMKYSLRNLMMRKSRSFLTILSIFVGIATIFIFISFGLGLYAYVNSFLQDGTVDKISIEAKGGAAPGMDTTFKLTDDDLNVVEKTNGVFKATGLYFKAAEIVQKKTNKYIFFISFDPKEPLIWEMWDIDILKGRQLEKQDRGKVVLGYNYQFPNKIMPKGYDVGDKININGIDMDVIGIIEEVGNPQDDSQVYVNNEYMEEIYPDDLSYGWIMASVDVKNIEEIVERVEKNLRKERGLEEGKEDFFVSSFTDQLESFMGALNIVFGFVVLIALISVLVSAVNTANTMVTSVLERINEIGVIKSIGARNSEIFKIFLFESSVLGIVSGVIGVIVGWIISSFAGFLLKALGWSFLQPYMPWYLFVGCIAFATLTGAISGVFPAYQASKLKPVDALRYE